MNEAALANVARGVRAASLAIALAAVFVALFVPVWPSFPVATQLDNSWVVGLNAVMDLGLAFGTQVVFTFGPYASVYTREYHPATDALMLFGGALLAAGYSVLFLALGTLRGRWIALATAVAALVLFRDMDALIFFYPLALGVFVFAAFLASDREHAPGWCRHPITLGVVAVPLGLLPLVKGSALLGCVSIAVLCSAALLVCGKRLHAAILLAVPVASGVALWLIAGQPLSALPWFFVNLLQIVSGYTAAMSGLGPITELRVYLLACVVILATVSVMRESGFARAFLLAVFALYLFLAMKAGFVRHDSHALMAAAAIGLAGLTTLMLRVLAAPLVVVVCLGAWMYIDAHHAKTETHTLVKRAINPFLALKGGWQARAEGRLAELAKSARVKLAAECPLEPFEGTVDIYSFRQACLVAAGARWSPRPVFQSYSAYTPSLGRMNAEHLLGKRAPDRVLFRVEPIDNRFPALEDGPSWPVLLQLYRPHRLDGDLAYLERREQREFVQPRFVGQMEAQVGGPLPLPESNRPLFAEVALEPTLLGRLASIVFKTTEPRVEVELASGEVREHRFVPGMAAAGFVLSPYVSNARDYLLLMESDSELGPQRVRSMKLTIGGWGPWLWSSRYSVRFFELPAITAGTSVVSKPLDRPYREPPLGGRVSARLVCDGSIDRLNGRMPAPLSLTTGRTVVLDGWTAASHTQGRLADQVLIAVTSGDGRQVYFPTRSVPRPDVRDHFNRPGLLHSGFEARIDLSGLGDEVALQVAQVVGGKLILCDPVRTLKISQ